MPWRWLGALEYAAATAIMERAREDVLAGADEVLLLCQHPPVITLGRRADRAAILATDRELAAAGVAVARSSRGGLATYHGPGQLMVYPVVRLRGSIERLLAAIAAALADVAAGLGAPGAAWRREPAGLWLGDRKLAACGIHLRRRVTNHGFALDLDTPAAAWEWIVPCGMRERPVISVAEVAGSAPPAAEVAPATGELVGRALAALAPAPRLTEPRATIPG